MSLKWFTYSFLCKLVVNCHCGKLSFIARMTLKNQFLFVIEIWWFLYHVTNYCVLCLFAVGLLQITITLSPNAVFVRILYQLAPSLYQTVCTMLALGLWEEKVCIMQLVLWYVMVIFNMSFFGSSFSKMCMTKLFVYSPILWLSDDFSAFQI